MTANATDATPATSSSPRKSAELLSSESSTHPFQISSLWQHITAPGSRDHPPTVEPVTILGKAYSSKEQYEDEIKAKIWLTYRFGFEPIAKAEGGPQPLSFIHSFIFSRSVLLNGLGQLPTLIDNESFTSDVGWGCMIRTSQSLLANSLLYLGDGSADSKHRIIDLFRDDSTSPFSLHNFIRVASDSPLKVKPGEWFGPNAASLSIKRLCDKLQQSGKQQGVPDIRVLISESCDLYDNQIDELLNQAADGVLILLPVRLGIDRINQYYYSSLKQLLALPSSVGIAGGKPSSSFYFVGFQESDFIYINPHNPQPYQQEVNYDSYHSPTYQRLDFNELDPSMMIGVMLRDKSEYIEFKNVCQEGNNKIVHFHPLARRLSKNDKTHKNSGFVNVQHEDIDSEIEVFNVGERKEIDDFVDLGDEDFEKTQAPQKDQGKNANSQDAPVTPKSVAHSYDEVNSSGTSEPFETIQKGDCDRGLASP